MPDNPVASRKLKSPLFIYSREGTMLPTKKRSDNPSLLKSPTPTPPPLYRYSKLKRFKESLVVIRLEKSIRESDFFTTSNNASAEVRCSLSQPKSNTAMQNTKFTLRKYVSNRI